MKSEKTVGHVDIISALHQKTGIPIKALNGVHSAYVETLLGYLMQGKNVTINGLGTVKILPVPMKKGRNPSTGETIDIPPTRRVKLIPHATVKNRLLETNHD